jgi:hypothetical protein
VSAVIINYTATDRLLLEMQAKGLASTGNQWLEIAVRQKNPALTVGVAATKLLCYDRLDRAISRVSTCN